MAALWKFGLKLCFLLITVFDANASHKYNVVIVGGGMAGLSAAEYLVNHGVSDVVIFEAKDRLGGRIDTVYLPSGPLENGAQWIHGAHITNNIYNFANLHKLITTEKCLSRKVLFIHSEGLQAYDDLYKKFEKDLETYQENVEETNRSISTEQYLNNAFEAITSYYSIDEKKYVRPIFNTHKVSQMFSDGYDLDNISVASDYKSIPCDLEISGGNSQFIDIMQNTVGDQRIFVNNEVTNIAWNDKEVKLIVRNEEDFYNITADYVICAVPLGVLKNRSSTLFTPKLPQRKLDAMNRLIFGKGVKIHLYYEKPFWWRNHLNLLLLGFNDEKYEKGRTEWIHRINAFSEIPDNPNVLLTVVFGKVASDVELLSNAEIGHQITLLLRNFTEDITIPEPNQVYKSNWIHDKYTLGVYTSEAISSIGNEIDILGEPLPETGVPRLLFAGEATAPKFYSTMHGARESGVREAIRLIQQINKA